MPTPKLCPRCGGPVHCQRSAVEHCDCRGITLTPPALDLMRSSYQDCLCPACLRALASAIDDADRRTHPNSGESV